MVAIVSLLNNNPYCVHSKVICASYCFVAVLVNDESLSQPKQGVELDNIRSCMCVSKSQRHSFELEDCVTKFMNLKATTGIFNDSAISRCATK